MKIKQNSRPFLESFCKENLVTLNMLKVAKLLLKVEQNSDMKSSAAPRGFRLMKSLEFRSITIMYWAKFVANCKSNLQCLICVRKTIFNLNFTIIFLAKIEFVDSFKLPRLLRGN